MMIFSNDDIIMTKYLFIRFVTFANKNTLFAENQRLKTLNAYEHHSV